MSVKRLSNAQRPSEFSNVLVGLEKRGLVAAHQVDTIVAKVECLGLEIHDALPSASPLIRLMRSQGITAYDASYLELAVALGVPLYTRDKLLRSAARTIGVSAP